MASKNSSPQITYNLEARPATPEQKDAGKRLFYRLIARANANRKLAVSERTKARAEGAAPPVESVDAKEQP